jgi:hypothetical protein
MNQLGVASTCSKIVRDYDSVLNLNRDAKLAGMEIVGLQFDGPTAGDAGLDFDEPNKCNMMGLINFSDAVLEDWPWPRGQIFEALALASDLLALALVLKVQALASWLFKRDKH